MNATRAAVKSAILTWLVSPSCTVKGWSMQDGSFLGAIPGNNHGVTALAFSPDQPVLAVGAGDRSYGGSVRFFSVANGQLRATWLQDPNDPASYITSVAYIPFGRAVAYSGADGVVIVASDPF
jgi:WD40 repeat protein